MQPIKKLDTQLANQIAAGEVVERPASVVKELLENSLDAGATRIDIEITSGGTGLIRIRDDGSGIPKEQLKLALSPHATSKISSLDDLEVIQSFGFRGEALSSISSVSRFTLSSRTKNADQGWQAEAKGRDMEVMVTPVAVAEGTRIDVRELFFNTPARRRFLRTDKTEYSHIEDVVKKVALANFNVAISLKHNGRMSRRYRAAENLQQQEQRVAAVCSREFMQRSIRLDLDYEGIQLVGWLALPDYHRSQTDGQYFYVNNRPVKDRVLNHAIRLAYQSFIPEGRVPAYVLYLTMDPRKVDVNVHPTKHEVRFHDGRLIHDLLVQAIERGLAEGKELVDAEFLIENKNAKAHQHKGDLVYGSNTDEQQHQAYRSLLQSAHSSAGQAIAESAHNLELGGWHLLTRLNNEHLLLEHEQQLVLLSLPVLLREFISLQNKTDQNALHKLLFPDIMVCADNKCALEVSELLGKFKLVTLVSEQQITIVQVPQWMKILPITLVCHELTVAFYKQYDESTFVNSVSFSASSSLLLKLLNDYKDYSRLQLKYLSKDSISDKFP